MLESLPPCLDNNTSAHYLPRGELLEDNVSTFTKLSIAGNYGAYISEMNSLHSEILEELVIGNYSFPNCRQLSFHQFPKLQSIRIGMHCCYISRNNGVLDMSSLCISDCHALQSIEIGSYSFFDYTSFEVRSCDALSSLTFGEYCFHSITNVNFVGRIAKADFYFSWYSVEINSAFGI